MVNSTAPPAMRKGTSLPARSIIAKGKLIYTGPTRDFGTDLDAFEETLIRLLTYQELTT